MNMTQATNAKIAIYGAGAMGTVLGALLTKGGLENVHLITRNIGHVNALNKKGATIVCGADKKEWNIPVKALLPNQMQEEYDVIFLMTKQRHNQEILTNLLPYLKKDGVLCTTQNGLPEPEIANIIGNHRTYGGVMTFGAGLMEDGKVELTSKISAMRMQIGGYQNDGTKLPILQEILSYASKVTNENFLSVTEDLLGTRWSKLTLNAAFSGLSVMTGLPFGKIAIRHKTRKLALAVMQECVAVANAQGVTLEKKQGYDMQKILGEKTALNTFIAYMVLPFAIKKHKKLYSGMLKDVENGRKCEIDFVNGIVCKYGAKFGVETPVCAQIIEIVHGIENGLYETDYKNVDFF